jgi:hypothetical protein
LPKSTFFDQYDPSLEQETLEDLIVESIEVYGDEIVYVPRTLNSYDEVYGEDDTSVYERAFTTVAYLRSFDGPVPGGNVMSKFGIELREQLTFTIARRTFAEDVGRHVSATRPNEGDVVYFPLSKRCYQVKFVDNLELYYPLGKLYSWKLECELFEYSSERFDTGIREIDAIQDKYTAVSSFASLLDEDGVPLVTEDLDYLVMEGGTIDDTLSIDASDEIQVESDTFIDFTEEDPFSIGGRF